MDDEYQKALALQSRRQEYELNREMLATCDHLRPIEREMRAAGIEVHLKTRSSISARCRVEADALRAAFSLPTFVEYAELTPSAYAFTDPLPAVIRCVACTSAIEVVQRRDEISGAPVFRSSEGQRSPDPSTSLGSFTDPFLLLRSRILPLARLIDAPTQLIPTWRQSMGTGLAHIESEGETYSYVSQDRGVEYERFSTTSVDELLYRIFRAVAYSMSSDLARPHQKPGRDPRREMFRQQLALLDRLNAEWVPRCAAEHREGLAQYPFVDRA